MLTEKNMRVVVRGGGDLASGVIAKLYHSGFQVVVLECRMPAAIRRTVSFSEAVYQKEMTVEDVSARLTDPAHVGDVLAAGRVPVLVDPEGDWIRRWNPDLLVTRYWMSWFAPSLGYVSRGMKGKCKVISILDNVIPHEPRFFDTPFTRYFLHGNDGFITLCDAVAEDLLKLEPEARYKVLPHPLYSHFGEKKDRTASEDKLGLEHGKKNILFFGLIRDYKGLDILLEAFAGLDDSYQLVIAGEPYGSFSRYEDLIEKAGKERIHTFLHYIKDSEVSDFFSAADVSVLPYKSATQSGISSVSYHFEVPMIVTDTGGLKETVGDRGTGIVAGEISPDCIRKEILSYFGDPGIRQECVRNIRKVKEELSWRRFCSGLVDFSKTL